MEGCRNPNLKAECAQSFEYSIGTHRKAPRASTQPDFLHLLLLTNSRDSSALMCKICVRPKVCRKKAGKSSTDFFPALPHIHANQQIMESGGVSGGVLILSFKLLIRLGNDKPYEGLIKVLLRLMKVLLRLMKVLLRLMKVLSFKALLRSDSPWIAELPYPLLIQSNGWFEPQPTKGIGIFAVLAMYVQHFPEFWQFWGSGVLRDHFILGGYAE